MPYMTGSILHIDDLTHELWVCFLDKPHEVDWDKVKALIDQAWEAFDEGIPVKHDELELLRDYENKLAWIRQVREFDRVCEGNVDIPLIADAVWAYWDEEGMELSPFEVCNNYHIILVDDDDTETLYYAMREYFCDSFETDEELEDYIEGHIPNYYNHNEVRVSPVSNQEYLFIYKD